MQLAPIDMAVELFDGSARTNEAADVHALGEACRVVHRDRVRVRHCESRRRRQAARVARGAVRARLVRCARSPHVDTGRRRSFRRAGRFLELDAHDADADGDSDSDDRSSVDEIVRKLSLRERYHGENEADEEENQDCTHMESIITLVELMLDTKLPCLKPGCVQRLRERFFPDKSGRRGARDERRDAQGVFADPILHRLLLRRVSEDIAGHFVLKEMEGNSWWCT
jgi:hypothetical protein